MGICAMEKKTFSKPFQELLGYLSKYREPKRAKISGRLWSGTSRHRRFQDMVVFVFSEDQILRLPVEDWPVSPADNLQQPLHNTA
jgi:hypothetical protein